MRARWDVVLVDEFQDVNPVQYRVIRALAREHKHVFAVGDDEQSIYSWAGADPAVFKSMANDFGIARKVHLEENRRCPREVFALARKLVTVNTPIFGDRVSPKAERESVFPVVTLNFETDDEEVAWIIDDIVRDRAEHGHDWGDVALLYRKHEIGDTLEGAFLNAGIPCRLAQGRALSEDPVVAYVLAALRVIASPTDIVYRDALLRGAASATAVRRGARAGRSESARSAAPAQSHGDATAARPTRTAARFVARSPIGRTSTRWASGTRRLRSLVQELLSRRVGRTRSVLDDRHDEISDPAGLPDVVALAARLAAARERNGELWIERDGRRRDRAQEHARRPLGARFASAASVRRTPSGSRWTARRRSAWRSACSRRRS